jgi:hypothetical protein
LHCYETTNKQTHTTNHPTTSPSLPPSSPQKTTTHRRVQLQRLPQLRLQRRHALVARRGVGRPLVLQKADAAVDGRGGLVEGVQEVAPGWWLRSRGLIDV